jgi:hypothetical protein
MSLSELAEFAVAHNNSRSPSQTPTYDLGIEEARVAVQIKDGNKIPREDGSQALTLRLGNIKLALDAVAPGATLVNATQEKVESFTDKLLAALANGEFDEAIVAAQEKGRAAAEKKAATKAANREAGVSEAASAGVDLDALDAAEGTDGEEVLG